jgi:hypothetical protein
VLKAWYEERKQQYEESLAMTLRNGNFVNTRSRIKGFLRDWGFWIAQMVPSWREALEQGPGGGRIPRYKYQDGFPFVPELGGGMLAPQVYAMDLRTGKLCFTDDLIFGSRPPGVLRILVLLNHEEEIATTWQDLAGLGLKTSGRLHEDQATFLVHRLDSIPLTFDLPATVQVARTASGSEYDADDQLRAGAPAHSAQYDANVFRTALGPNVRHVILRHDRFIYAACDSREQLLLVVEQLPAKLGIAGASRAKL